MGKKIVVADDESHILHVVSMKLSNAGYEVLTAVDGEEALELCRSEKPDMVITDFQMPVMTGLELCKTLRQEGFMAPVLMLTARGFDIGASDMASARIADVLSKPFSPREVLGKVQQLLGGPQTKEVVGLSS
jgi:two-component system alkaline phosphatase synthesis response regulator PhoP